MCFIFSCADAGHGTPSATGTKNRSTVAIARRNIRKIEGKFSMLVTNSQERLQSRINVKKFRIFLVTMYSSPNSRDGMSTITTVIQSTESLDEMFVAFGQYGLWDYLNYDLLQEIIEEFASDDDELNDMMKQYQQDLTGHILTQKIATYLEAIHEEPPISSSDSDTSGDEIIPALPQQKKRKLFKKLSFKVETNVADQTLGYVKDLWRSLQNQFRLPRPAMILHRIAEGCICITWLIPTNLVTHVTRMAQETANMFAKQHILRVMLAEHCIYPMAADLETEHPLLEPKPSLPEIKPSLLETKPPQPLTGSPPLKTGLPSLETDLPLTESKPTPLEIELPPTETKPPPLETELPPTETKPPPLETELPLIETKPPPLETELLLKETKPSLPETELPLTETKLPPSETELPLLVKAVGDPAGGNNTGLVETIARNHPGMYSAI